MSGLSSRSVSRRILDAWRSGRWRTYGFHLSEFVRCTTPLRFANLVLAKAQRRLRCGRVVGMPFAYFIDPINVCNLRCPLCPTGRGVLARRHGRMTLPDLKRIVDEIAPYAYRIELYNWGEPLLHPQIFEMIRYISKRRITVGLSSNLNHLDAEMARQLVESGLSQLIVSIDGATQESYAAYRQRGNLDKALRNLQLLLKTRHQLKRRTPFIIWRMLIGKHNENEIDKVREMAQIMGVDGFSIGMLFVDTRDPEQVEQWLPTNPAYSCYDYAEEEIHNTWNCHDLWESMVINWDGGVAPCCWLHDAQFDFGNATQHTVRKIWNSPSYVSARRIIARRKKRPDDLPTVCSRCRGNPLYMAH